MSKILVKVRVIAPLLSFQTVSLENGVSPQFFLPVSKFEELDRTGDISAQSITDVEHPIPHQSAFHRITSLRQLFICFHWLNSPDEFSPVRAECVRLPYDDLEAFIGEQFWRNSPTEWKCLSLEEKTSPRLVFLDKRNLRHCLANEAVRRKLIRCLRDKFSSRDVREVHFRDRAVPYSFTYQEICDTAVRTVGTITLFYQNELEKAYYRERSHKESNPARPEYRKGFDPYLDDRWDLE